MLAAGTIIALLHRRREAQRLVRAEAEAQAAEERQAAARRAPVGRQRRARRRNVSKP